MKKIIILSLILLTYSQTYSQDFYYAGTQVVAGSDVHQVPNVILMVIQNNNNYSFTFGSGALAVQNLTLQAIKTSSQVFFESFCFPPSTLPEGEFTDNLQLCCAVNNNSYIDENSIVFVTQLNNSAAVDKPFVTSTFNGHYVDYDSSPIKTWQRINNANGYRIDFYTTLGKLSLSANFDLQGVFIDIVQKSLSLKTTEPFSFDANTLGLKENETFYYTITALTEEGETQIKEGVFKTGEKTEPVSIETTSVPAVPVAYYNLLGQKLQQEPTSGMYIVRYSNGTCEKRVR
ncbi:MAG: hypothetical protein LBU90_10045 [Bacteroidales bacterium]|jgi:hypothetical protein|nr:hypothetical protein [Bacteroidales bacterium]